MGSVERRRLLAGLRQESGHELVGELLKGVMDPNFQISEAFGLLGELLDPDGLLATQVLGDSLHYRRRRGYLGTGLSTATHLHGSVFLHATVVFDSLVKYKEGKAAAPLLGNGPFWEGGSDEPFFFILAIIVCPALFVIGAVGSTVLLVRSKMTKIDKE